MLKKYGHNVSERGLTKTQLKYELRIRGLKGTLINRLNEFFDEHSDEEETTSCNVIGLFGILIVFGDCIIVLNIS